MIEHLNVRRVLEDRRRARRNAVAKAVVRTVQDFEHYFGGHGSQSLVRHPKLVEWIEDTLQRRGV